MSYQRGSNCGPNLFCSGLLEGKDKLKNINVGYFNVEAGIALTQSFIVYVCN